MRFDGLRMCELELELEAGQSCEKRELCARFAWK